MDSYRLNIEGITRDLPLVAIDETDAYASFVIISDLELIKTCAPVLAKKVKDADIIVTAEAKGIALAYEIASCLGHKYFAVARKSVKSYMNNPISVSVHSITTHGEQHLYLDEADAKLIEGKNVCLLDDVISTGESMEALEELVNCAGGNVLYRAAVLAEGDAAKRDDIIYLGKLPLFTTNALGDYEEKES